jgi:integrase
VRVLVGRNPENGRPRYVSREVRGGKRVAERAAAQLVAEVERGGHQAQAGRHTVADLLDRWLAHIEAQGRAMSTLVRYRSAIDANIKPRLGSIPIAKLGPADVDRYYADLAKIGLSPLTIRKSHAILSAAFNQALKWGWLDRNPVDRASPPGLRGREIHPPTPGELASLLEACDTNPDLHSLIYVAATTGARRGELCGLRWGDFDMDLATLTIARSISDAGKVVAEKDTKTHQARRIALDPSTVDALRQHRKLMEERAVAAGKSLGASSYVWSQELDASRPYRPDRVSGAFVWLRDKLNLPHVTFHALRHFSATTLAGQGVGVRTIAGRLGHANPGITLRTYAHFLDTADREAAAVMGKAMAGLYSASDSRSSAPSRARRGTTSRRPSRTDGSSPRATKS